MLKRDSGNEITENQIKNLLNEIGNVNVKNITDDDLTDVRTGFIDQE